MALGKLKKPKVATNGIERFARFYHRPLSQRTGRYRARLGPSFEPRFSVIIAQTSKVSLRPQKANLKRHSHLFGI